MNVKEMFKLQVGLLVMAGALALVSPLRHHVPPISAYDLAQKAVALVVMAGEVEYASIGGVSHH